MPTCFVVRIADVSALDAFARKSIELNVLVLLCLPFITIYNNLNLWFKKYEKEII